LASLLYSATSMAWDSGRASSRPLALLLPVSMFFCGAEPAGGEPAVDPVPPFLSEGVAPNLILTMDDARTMARGDAPTLADPGEPGLQAYFSSPDVNRLYYAPDRTYVPGMQADGALLPDSLFNAASRYPYNGAACGNTAGIDLSTEFQAVIERDRCGDAPRYLGAPSAAYYDRYNPDHAYVGTAGQDGELSYQACADPQQDPLCRVCGEQAGFPNDQTPDPCFDRVYITSSDREAQNFANWYSYYRTRMLTAKTVVSRVMQNLPPQVRLTFQDGATRLGFKPGDPAFDRLSDPDHFDLYERGKSTFFAWLYALGSDQATYMAATHVRAGEFVSQGIATADDIAAHRAEFGAQAGAAAPTAANSCGVKCRKNFHLLMTEGDWSDAWGAVGALQYWPETTTSDGRWIQISQDGIGHPLPMNAPASRNAFGNIDYAPNEPATALYADKNVGMLADIAFYYWARDLDGDSSNNAVQPSLVELAADSREYDAVNFWNPSNDPAEWQHLTLYTVGFGGTGAVAPLDGAPYGTFHAGTQTYTLQTNGFPDGDEPSPYTASAAAGYEPDGPFSAVGGIGSVWLADRIPPAAKSDDLYHAALNARGRYFNALEPRDLVASFADALRIVSATAAPDLSTTAPVLNSTTLDGDSKVYQAVLNATHWSGEVRAYRVSAGYGRDPCGTKPRGELCESHEDPYWGATAEIPSPNNRVIITQAAGAPAAFRPAVFDELSTAQQRGLLGCGNAEEWIGDLAYCALSAPLDAEDPARRAALARIDYLRGVRTYETADTGALYDFRIRDGLLGDILGSNLVVVSAPARLFNDEDYVAFRQNLASRPPMLYVGANDGMLHGFDAANGVEQFAYVPQAIYFPGLADLSDPDYGRKLPKRAFVDGRINTADARFTDEQGDAGWHTVLIGALGLGAQAVYALDVTNPRQITEQQAADLVLWEFTDAAGSDGDDGALDGRDMGFSFGEPAIVRIDDDLSDEKEPIWVALVSNGYNNTNTQGEEPADCTDDDAATNCTVSQTGDAVLYVLALGGGDEARILAKMDTGRGRCQDPRITSDPGQGSTCADEARGRTNALAQVTAVDADGDLIADLAYAGDLFGNLWRFDLVDTANPPTLVFSARDGDGNPQPITTKVVYQRHPSGIGTLLLFGTGQYLNSDDKTDFQVQSFYGIWDDGALVHGGGTGSPAVPTRADLLKQELGSEVSIQAENQGAVVSLSRSSSDYQIDWSARRGWFIDLVSGDGISRGERVVNPPQVRGNRVVFVSMIPGDCCSAGGTSWVNALDANDGSRLKFTPFDYNLDGNLDSQDLIAVADGPAVQGSSIRLLMAGGTGVYTAPSLLGLGGNKLQSLVSDSQGDLLRLQESAALSWRNWLQRE